jgi:hypothetical protein
MKQAVKEKLAHKAQERIIEELHLELEYFVHEYSIAEDMEKLLKEGNKEAVFKRIKSKYLKDLKNQEFKQQLWSSTAVLQKKLNKFLSAIHLHPKFTSIKYKITTLVKRMEVFEAKVLTETAEKLRPEIEPKKNASEVNWVKVNNIVKEILTSLRAFVLLNKQLTQLLGGRNRV